jgi:hypothetical protein
MTILAPEVYQEALAKLRREQREHEDWMEIYFLEHRRNQYIRIPNKNTRLSPISIPNYGDILNLSPDIRKSIAVSIMQLPTGIEPMSVDDLPELTYTYHVMVMEDSGLDRQFFDVTIHKRDTLNKLREILRDVNTPIRAVDIYYCPVSVRDRQFTISLALGNRCVFTGLWGLPRMICKEWNELFAEYFDFKHGIVKEWQLIMHIRGPDYTFMATAEHYRYRVKGYPWPSQNGTVYNLFEYQAVAQDIIARPKPNERDWNDTIRLALNQWMWKWPYYSERKRPCLLPTEEEVTETFCRELWERIPIGEIRMAPNFRVVTP